ncbi:MAG: CHASE2 domain-containing protein [Candidatus Omnitrophica bacterium]|nr:CHASE2 domain-containing protein [Candidatus Omnitrophota bacterium]
MRRNQLFWKNENSIRPDGSGRFRVLRSAFLPLLASCLILVLFLWLQTVPTIFNRLEAIVLDSFFRERPRLMTHPNIVFIDIDQKSVERLDRLPWPRTYFAAIVHILDQWKTEAVVFDIVFWKHSRNSAEDTVLADSIAQNGRVYLPVFFVGEAPKIMWMHSLPEFEQKAKSIGHINVLADIDGVVRRIQPYVSEGNRSYIHLGLQVALDWLERQDRGSAKIRLPLDRSGNFMVNWTGRWANTFTHYSLVDILQSFEDASRGKPPLIPPEALKGKICLIGSALAAGADTKATPLEVAFPGIGIMANIINSVMTGQMIRPATSQENALALVLLGILAMFIFIPFRNFLSMAGAFVLSLGWCLFAFAIFVEKGIWLSVANPVLMIAGMLISCAVIGKIQSDREKNLFSKLATNDGLTGLYLRRHFQTLLASAIRRAQRKNESLALMMIDIDNFKHINDAYGHPAGDLVLREWP